MRTIAHFCALALLISVSSWAGAQAWGERVMLRVLSVDKKTFAAAPVRPATVIFDVQQGKPPEKGEVLVCKQQLEDHDFEDHRDRFVVLQCGDQIVILRGVFFE